MSINILPASANYIADSLLYAYNWNWLAGRMGGGGQGRESVAKSWYLQRLAGP